MKEPQEIRIAWVIWHLIFHLNDRLWDYYEEEFLELSANPGELEKIDGLVAKVKNWHLPF